MSGPVTASLVNPFHNTIDLSTSEGKKLHQKATAGLPEVDKHTCDSKDMIKFVERIESHREDLGWKKSGENIGSIHVMTSVVVSKTATVCLGSTNC